MQLLAGEITTLLLLQLVLRTCFSVSTVDPSALPIASFGESSYHVHLNTYP